MVSPLINPSAFPLDETVDIPVAVIRALLRSVGGAVVITEEDLVFNDPKDKIVSYWTSDPRRLVFKLEERE